VITLGLIFVLVVWKFRTKGYLNALYNGIVAAFFTLFLYEIIFNLTGRFPPTGNLPLWGIGLMILSLILGIIQAIGHFRFHRIAIVFLVVFVVDWIFWIIIGFPFNFPRTNPINLTAEMFNTTTKLLLPLGYFAVLSSGTLREVKIKNKIQK
jgi:hypothetical protein